MPRKPAEPGVDRRQQILEAALSVFAERGFEASTNKKIADQAGVNQGLIYFYFESKADLFFAAFDYHVRLVVAQIDAVFDQRHSDDPVTGFAQILAEISAILRVIRTVNLVRIMFQVQSSRSPDGVLNKEKPHTMQTFGTLAKHLTTAFMNILRRRSPKASCVRLKRPWLPA